mgnify:FL=1
MMGGMKRLPDPFADLPYWMRVALGVVISMGVMIGFAYVGVWIFGDDGGVLGLVGMFVGLYLPPHLPEHDRRHET